MADHRIPVRPWETLTQSEETVTRGRTESFVKNCLADDCLSSLDKILRHTNDKDRDSIQRDTKNYIKNEIQHGVVRMLESEESNEITIW